MAPTRSKKRNSTESTSSLDVQGFPAPPQHVPTNSRSPARTPSNRSPVNKPKMHLTLAQKQALIDNLQLESQYQLFASRKNLTNSLIVTERARKLRAQYMLQAQGLRTRIEIRVNRIPMTLRRAKMGELLLKHSDNTSKSTSTAAASPVKIDVSTKSLLHEQRTSRASLSPHSGRKRHRYAVAVV